VNIGNYCRAHAQWKLGFCAILLVVLPCLSAGYVQSQCTQKLADLPAATELLGFRLGMTKEEVNKMVPQTRFGRIDDFGVSKTTINPHFDTSIDDPRFVGVRSVSLDFLDNRLISLWIGFDETYKVQAMDEFARVISQSLRLPGAWSPWRSGGKQMRCADFQITLQTVARGPSFRVLDAVADDTIAARRQAKEESDAAVEAARENGNPENTGITGDRKTKTYYPAGCEAAKDVATEDRIVFKNVEEAERAGFKLAKGCN